ncbi:MAG: 4Fe-4S dicluster-binding protein [Balneolaceae bacterium]|nr:4Fe-4S dicluster-binding protein [Balneolaceae bacterium]
MSNDLKRYSDLAVGANIEPGKTYQPHTGSWRMGTKPEVHLAKCVDCMLCWVYCPDTAVLVEEDSFYGFDYRYCKGCELCAEVCPADAIEMVAEEKDLPEFGRITGGSNEDSR